MKILSVLLIICLFAAATSQDTVIRYIKRFSQWLLFGHDPLPTVNEVKLSKYQGTWYEIFRLPKAYENCEDGCINIDYKFTHYGGFVTIRCVSHENQTVLSEVKAFANPRDEKHTKFDFCLTNKRKCQDYQILEMEKDYEWVLIGSADRKSLWLLSRKSTLSSDIIKSLIDRADELQFDTRRLIYQTEKCHPGQTLFRLDEKIVQDIFKFFHIGN